MAKKFRVLDTQDEFVRSVAMAETKMMQNSIMVSRRKPQGMAWKEQLSAVLHSMNANLTLSGSDGFSEVVKH